MDINEELEIVTTAASDDTTTTLKQAKDVLNTDTVNKHTGKAENDIKMSSDVVVDLTTANANTEIISLSDGEDDLIKPNAKITKKRRSAGDNKLAEDEHYNQLKRRKIKVAGAPKMPLTGYLRYMNDRRESLRKEFPNKTALEHTKIICEEWHQLSKERKAPYMKAYELDKQRYEDELNSFLKANPNVLANELAKHKQIKQKANEAKTAVLKEKGTSEMNIKTAAPKPINNGNEKQPDSNVVPSSVPNSDSKKIKRTPTPTMTTMNPPANPTTAVYAPGEIPIFTNEFLEHNKVCDMELRTLRKSKQDLEQQNAVLEKHVENMKVGVQKMTTENNELQKKNKLLERYLLKLKRKLAGAFGGLALPNEPNGATADNIENYLSELYKMATTNTHGPACLNKAKDILRKLDMQINL